MLRSRNLLLLIGLCGLTNGLPSATPDPCAGATCGIGAQCEKAAHLIVCVCPDDTIGDPFVECKGTPPSDKTTTEFTMSTNTTPAPEPVTSTLNTYTTTSSAATTTSTSPSTTRRPPTKPIVTDTTTTSSYNSQNLYPGSNPGRRDDTLLAQFASAPPTLSHYAHSHSHAPAVAAVAVNTPSVVFIPNEAEAPTSYYQKLTELYSGSGSRTRTRPQQQHQQPQQSKPQPQPEHEHMHLHNHDRNNHHGNHDHPHDQRNHYQSTHFDLRQPQRHQENSNSYYPTGPSNTAFNFGANANANFPMSGNGQNFPSSRIEDDTNENYYYKDPSGKYADCRTINNMIVCAENEDNSKIDTERNTVQQIRENIAPFLSQVHTVSTQSQKMSRPRPMSIIPTMRPAKPIYEDSSSLEVGSEPGFNNYRLDGPYGHPPMIQANYDSTGSGTTSASSIFRIPTNPQPGTPEFEMCTKFCGIDAVCRIMLGRPICGCSEGHTGDPAVRCFPIKNSKFDKNSCVRHIDCHASKVCIESQCVDPCSVENETTKLCGVNAKCHVIHHTPLCGCLDGYDGNPYVGCVI